MYDIFSEKLVWCFELERHNLIKYYLFASKKKNVFSSWKLPLLGLSINAVGK